MSSTENNANSSPAAGSGTPAPSNGGVNNSGNVPNTGGNSSPSCPPSSNTAAEGANAAISSVGSTSTATTTTTSTGEPLKIIKTQLIPFHALPAHSQIIATAPPTLTNINAPTFATTIKPLTTTQTNNTHIINLSTTSHLATIQLKNLSHPFALNPSVPAKITQVKSTEPSVAASSGNGAAAVSSASITTTASPSVSLVTGTTSSGLGTSSSSSNSSTPVNISTSVAAVTLASSAPATLTSASCTTGVTVTATPIALTVPPTTVIATTVPPPLTVATSANLVNPSNVTSTTALTPASIATSSSLTNIKTTSSGTLGSSAAIVNASSSSGPVTNVNTSNLVTNKLTASGNGTIALASPLALNTSIAPITTSASIRAIGAGGQSAQVRVVMPTSSMIKQLEGVAPGRTQITALPASPVPRTITNTSITVTRPATYLPRATVTATPLSGVANGQRLVTPVRATSAALGATGATVTGITASGSFVKGTAVSRNSASPGTTIISPAPNATWMTANSATGQVQLIRNLPQQSRQRIITTQGIPTVVGSSLTPLITPPGNVVSSASVTGTPTVSQVGLVAASNQNGQNQSSTQQATIQSVSSPTSVSVHSTQQQPTYVATLSTVLPPRQHPASLVYSSNVAGTTQAISQSQGFNPTVATTQRFAVATQLTAATGATGATRQIRPFQFSKGFSAAKLSTTSISIRAPNLPQLTPTLTAGVSGANVTAGSSSPRSTTVTGAGGNVIPTSNLQTTRIFQLQQPPNGTTPQIIGSTGRLAGNVMLQPIILNSGGKIGIRPPVTMAAKVQPSLTITQLGIGKLSSAGAANALNTQNLGANIQTLGSSVGGVSSSLTGTGTLTATNLSASGGGPHLLSAQNIITSSAASTSATVVPLAITTRGATAGNILTGTITPIKSANGITLGKVMASSAAGPVAVSNSNIIETSATITPAAISNVSSLASGNANVFIHQRPNSTGGANVAISVPSSNIASSSTTTTTSSLSTISQPTSSSAAFLPPGSTIYYESIPASTLQVSTGVLSLTTTTVSNTSSLQSQNTASTAITSMPYSTHPSSSTPTTFTVVPSTGGRTIGQLQIPASSAASQLTAVPFRFNNQVPSSNVSTSSITAIDSITVAQPKAQLVSGQQIIIPAAHSSSNASNTLASGTQMVIPLQTSIKVTAGALGGTGSSTIMPNFIRKRDLEGPLRAAKNLGPTLLSMSANSQSGCASPVPCSISYSMSPIALPLTVETLAKKDRAAALAAGNLITSSRSSKAASPASSDGSTTLSVTSSPGLDQQMQDGGLIAGHDSMHFNPIKDLYANHPSLATQHNLPSTSGSSRNSSLDHRQQLQPSPTSQRLNGGSIIQFDCPPRKKSRRSTIDSQISTQSHSSLNLPPPNNLINPLGVQLDAGGLLGGGSGDLLIAASSMQEELHNPCLLSNSSSSSTMLPAGNKENAKPTEYVLRKPRSCTLLNGYKLTWKGTNNHFQRYSDVKPRKPNTSVIDLANQPNILAKINGWKVYHLQSQMKDLCDDENSAYEKLADMLKQMETHEQSADTERISDLIKGNMQRSKIIVDGVNEAQNQIMKIFEHKSHVSDIITRCASKRNFKKREKV